MAIKGQLLAVGGAAYSAPTNPSLPARYKKYSGSFYTNEHNIYDTEKGNYQLLLIAGTVCMQSIQCSTLAFPLIVLMEAI